MVPENKEREKRTHLIDEQHSRHQLCDSLLDVPVHDLVDLSSQLVRDFSPSTLHQLTHHAHDVLSSLGSSVGHVEIVQRHVLNELLLLVDVSFGKGNVGLGLEIVFRGVGVRTTDSLLVVMAKNGGKEEKEGGKK